MPLQTAVYLGGLVLQCCFRFASDVNSRWLAGTASLRRAWDLLSNTSHGIWHNLGRKQTVQLLEHQAERIAEMNPIALTVFFVSTLALGTTIAFWTLCLNSKKKGAGCLLVPSSELQDLGAAAKERESRVLSLLSSLNLQHTCLLGDASTLAALRDLQALDRIPHVNTVHKYKPRGREQTICPPLMVAVAEGHRAVLELLLQHPLLDVDMPEANLQCTALMWAAADGQHDMVCALLAHGAQANHQAAAGQTALGAAAAAGHLQVVQALLAAPAGIDVNQQDSEGYTALMWAARYGHADVVQALLQTDGIDTKHAAKDGQTACSIAQALGHGKVMDVLR